MPVFNRQLVIFCLMMLIAIIPLCIGQGEVMDEYEATAAHTKTVTITNTTQTDVAFELLTVSKWGRLIANYTWDGQSGDDLLLRVNFWTISFGEANQADYGDMGSDRMSRYTTFPETISHECKLYYVDAEELPVTIFYEVDTTQNTNHEITPGTTVTLEVKYFNLTGEEATTERFSASLAMVVLALGVIAISWRKRKNP